MNEILTTKCKAFLSRRSVSLLIVFAGIIGRIIQLVFFYNIRVDASYQVMAMQNFVYGHGITVSHVSPNNLSTILYEPLINWPPGYSLLLAPFYVLFRHDYIVAGLALDISCAILLILMARATLTLFNVPLYLRNIFTLLTSFFIYIFYFIASSDAVAIAFFVSAIFLSGALLKDETLWIKKTIVLSFCLLVCGFIKYLFIPVVFIVPLFLFAKGFASKEKKLRKAGITSFIILLIGLGSLLIYQKAASGSVAYISQTKRGFFPEHILNSYPFLPASFLKPETLQQITHSNVILIIYQLIHFVFVILLLIYVLYQLRKYKLRNLPAEETFFILCFLLSAAITSLLIWLSLWVAKEEIMPGYFWTYVEEPRYYGLICVLVQLNIFIFYKRWKRSTSLKPIFYFLVLLLAIEMLHGMFFDLRRILLFSKEEYSWQYEDRFEKYADGVLKLERDKYKAEKIVVTGSSYYLNHRVSLYSHVPVMYDSLSINTVSQLKTRSPVLLIVILNQKNFSSYQHFLLKQRNEAAGKFEGFYFYSVYVRPN